MTTIVHFGMPRETRVVFMDQGTAALLVAKIGSNIKINGKTMYVASVDVEIETEGRGDLGPLTTLKVALND